MSRRKSAPESPAGIRADQPCKNGQPLVAPDGSCLRCGADQGVACRDVTYHGHKTMLDGTSQHPLRTPSISVAGAKTMTDKKTLKFQMMMSPEEAKVLDDWMFENRIRSRAEAIRRLCQIGLATESVGGRMVVSASRLNEALAQVSGAEGDLKRKWDGVANTSEEAEVIWQAVEAATVKRAERLPTAESALRALLDAQERLRELGWSLGGGLRVRRGDDCAVAQTGSTGIWRGWVDAEGSYVHFGDYCVSPRDAWLIKPLSDLTPDELAHMQKCDAEGAAAYSAMIEGLARMETDNG